MTDLELAPVLYFSMLGLYLEQNLIGNGCTADLRI